MTKEGGAGRWNDPDGPHHGQVPLERRKLEIKQWGENRERGEKKLKTEVKGTDAGFLSLSHRNR